MRSNSEEWDSKKGGLHASTNERDQQVSSKA